MGRESNSNGDSDKVHKLKSEGSIFFKKTTRAGSHSEHVKSTL